MKIRLLKISMLFNDTEKNRPYHSKNLAGRMKLLQSLLGHNLQYVMFSGLS